MLKSLTRKEHAPRWLILIIDLIISASAMYFSLLLRFNFEVDGIYFQKIEWILLFVMTIRLAIFFLTRSYAGIIRYTGTRDAERIFLIILASNFLFAAANLVSYYFVNGLYIIPFSVISIDFFISIFLLTAFRLFVKLVYSEAENVFRPEKRIIILGINKNALSVRQLLSRHESIKYRVEAFIDPESKSLGKKVDNIVIYGVKDIKKLFDKYDINEFILSDDKSEIKSQIIEICLENNVKVLTVPEVDSWINGELSVNQLRQIKIEDLLERDAIQLNSKQITKYIAGKKVLVTGAAGSIGRELVIQAIQFLPKQIIAFDQAESPLYDLELEVEEKLKFKNAEIVIGDITNFKRLEKVFSTFRPEIILHAAAYKHVPMMENNPYEAVQTNIGGTKNIADLAVQYNAEKFVMISTDKAVNPTNVMGASKRIAEIYIQTLNATSKTEFITTRFGNVLGSNGSVIPRFKKQIEKGGPVTVTHPEITRFFMTIPEACQLVLQAGAIGSGGEIFIFDMGESVKIADLAKKMVKLSGLKIGTDIQISFTGLRPGEKLYEELLNDKENTIPTEHSKIMAAKVRVYQPQVILPEITRLIQLSSSTINDDIVIAMKALVPEFKSKNSIYEKLD